jgi:opacity protein-like surface antigen
VDFLVHKNVTFKAGWNYYQYAENDFVGPTAPRYFHANNATLALRYAFWWNRWPHEGQPSG